MFPDRLKALRKGQHLTLAQLAKKLNANSKDKKHPNTGAQMENWERGIRFPPYTEIMKLAQFFHVSMDYLCGNSATDNFDISQLFIGNRHLKFNGQDLNESTKREIYAMIQGYLKSHRDYTKKHKPEHKASQLHLFN